MNIETMTLQDFNSGELFKKPKSQIKTKKIITTLLQDKKQIEIITFFDFNKSDWKC